LYSNVRCWYLSGKGSISKLFGRTPVYFTKINIDKNKVQEVTHENLHGSKET